MRTNVSILVSRGTRKSEAKFDPAKSREVPSGAEGSGAEGSGRAEGPEVEGSER